MRNKESVNLPVRFKVRGVLPFPIDMLRYDACWPASETDSNIIVATMQHEHEGRVDVVVRSRQPLTVGRWKSFGWDVIGAVED